MDDEIDIEEHDVMDNPALRNVFPDLSVLKKEILAYDEADQFVTHGLDEETEIQKPDSTTDDTLLTSCATENPSDEPSEQTLNFSQSNPLQEDNMVYVSMKKKTLTIQNVESSLQSNKIILGSKPNKNPKHNIFPKLQKLSHEAKVVLENLSPFLNKSQRYCEQCLILFPGKRTFDAHKENCHAKLTKKGIIECTKKQNQTIVQVEKKVNRCNVCDKNFATLCNLKRHIRNVHKISQQETLKESSTSNSCFHCKKVFPTQKTLIEHLYEVLQSKIFTCGKCTENFVTRDKYNQHMLIHNSNKSTDLNQEFEGKRKQENIKEHIESDAQKSTGSKLNFFKDKLYRCSICFYYFKHNKFYFSHMAVKHKITKYHTPIRESFKPMCKLCLNTFTNIVCYNIHIHKRHKSQLNQVIKIKPRSDHKIVKNIAIDSKTTEHPSDANTLKIISTKTPQNKKITENPIEILILKSTLFKCLKCDINFLSAKTAMLHSNHMNMLINWKCTICQRIFKKNDELLHLKQHSFSQTFDVYNLTESALSNVLYHCLKCAVYFTDDILLRHYPLCGTQTPSSVYCKVCDILIGHEIWRNHELNHKYKKLESTDFTLIDADIIVSDNQQENSFKNNKIKIKNRSINSRGRKVNKLSSSSSDKVKLKTRNYKIRGSHSDKILSKDLKTEFSGKDARKLKRKCSMKDTTKLTLPKKLRLTIYNNEHAYIYCNTCKCCLKTYCKQIHLQSRCENMLKYVCKYCGLIFTNKSINTHRKLHENNKRLTLQDFKFYSLKSGKQISPPVTEFPACEVCDVQFVYKVASQRHVCVKENYLTCHICYAKLSEAAFKLHMLFHNYSIQNMKHNMSNSKTEENLKNATVANAPKSIENIEHFRDSVSYFQNEILKFCYTCANCNVTLETYDKVVEHCHQHYDRNGMQLSTKICTLCNLKFIKEYYAHHEMSHKIENKESLNKIILKFDTFYFMSEKSVWLKHLFGSLAQEHVQEILSQSIYKIENKIKMEIIQEGPPDLTLYKCNKCRCFIDPWSLNAHINYICSNLKKYACTFCGVPFTSFLSKTNHEKIHSRPNISLNSYRIVMFNKEKDKLFNKDIRNRNKYVLYQCRNCNGIVDKLKLDMHKCDSSQLKKCIHCGLLLYNGDYHSHILKHKNIENFDSNNIKLVLTGEKHIHENEDEDVLVPSFDGTVHDYVLLKCIKCEVYLRNMKGTPKHDCGNNFTKSKCPVCHFRFFHTDLNNHRELHDNDPEFMRENIKIIPFEITSEDNVVENINEQLLLSNSILISIVNKEILGGESSSLAYNREKFETEKIGDKVNEETNDSISIPEDSNKYVVINEEHAFQKPLKCINTENSQNNNEITSTSKGFLINNIPEELELGKQSKNDMSLVELRTNSDLMENNNKFKEIKNVTIYKCKCCELHFLNEYSVISHLEHRTSKVKICKQSCPKCDLLFTPNVLFNHLIMHHGEKNDDFKFVIKEVSNPET